MKFIIPAMLCAAVLVFSPPASPAPIHDAARGGDLEAVREIVSREPLAVNSLDESGRTPLIVAAAAGQREVVSLLIERGALVNATNDRGATSLHFAASRGDSQIVRTLIGHGAVVNARAIGCATPLCWASCAGREGAARVLITEGANVNAECIDLWTPLYRAAASGNAGLVELLLLHGAGVNMQCIEGKTPLHNAVESGSEDIVGLLVDENPEVDVRDVLGRTPLWAAVEGGHAGIARLLLERGAEIYENEFESGQTVLHRAALRGYGDVVDLLIEAGADPELEDEEGHTAAGLAARYGHNGVARALAPRRFSEGPPILREEQPSALRYPLEQGEAVIYYLGGYGIAVRTTSHLLVLDYSEPGQGPDEPSLANGHMSPHEIGGMNVLAVVPGLRTGFPIRAVMDLHASIPDMNYVLGFRTERGPEHVYVEPMESAVVDGIGLKSIAPNRYAHGQEFLIAVDGVTIYKGFSWDNWDEQSSASYRDGIRYLGGSGQTCDIAIIPYAAGARGTREMILSDLLYMAGEIGPRAALCVGGTWQYARDFALEIEEKGISNLAVFARYPGDAFIYRGGTLEALK